MGSYSDLFGYKKVSLLGITTVHKPRTEAQSNKIRAEHIGQNGESIAQNKDKA